MANEKNLKPFKKGADDRRNLNGRPPKLPHIDKLLDEVLGEEKDGITAAKIILMALRSKATKGDVRAAEILLDRAYGKSLQKINLEDRTIYVEVRDESKPTPLE
jgi:hypothetical protein